MRTRYASIDAAVPQDETSLAASAPPPVNDEAYPTALVCLPQLRVLGIRTWQGQAPHAKKSCKIVTAESFLFELRHAALRDGGSNGILRT